MRNKLADLVDEVLRCLPWGEISQNTAKDVADHLIANGVTFATDNNVGSKWIPVSERMPEPWQWVLCYCRAGMIEMLRYDHLMDEWGAATLSRVYMKGYVTHWMPLPEPPAEDE